MSIDVYNTDFSTVELGESLATVFKRREQALVRLMSKPLLYRWLYRRFSRSEDNLYIRAAQDLDLRLQQESERSWRANRVLVFADLEGNGTLTTRDEIW